MDPKKEYQKLLSEFISEKENVKIDFQTKIYNVKENKKKLELSDYENYNVFDPNRYRKK